MRNNCDCDNFAKVCWQLYYMLLTGQGHPGVVDLPVRVVPEGELLYELLPRQHSLPVLPRSSRVE